MKMLKGLLISLVLLGFSSTIMAWNVTVHNKTPFGIMVKVKSWHGLLNGGWVVIPAGQVAKAGPRGSDCIDGMDVQVNLPMQGYTSLGYFKFKFAPMSPCKDTTAVVGVEPIIEAVSQGGYSQMGTIGETKYMLKTFKFYVGHVNGNVDTAPESTDLKF